MLQIVKATRTMNLRLLFRPLVQGDPFDEPVDVTEVEARNKIQKNTICKQKTKIYWSKVYRDRFTNPMFLDGSYCVFDVARAKF